MLKNKNSNPLKKIEIRNQSFRLRKTLSITKYYRSFSIMKNFVKYFKLNCKDPIGCYWPTNSEIDTRPLISYLIEKKIPIALPVIDDSNMLFKKWDPLDQLHYSKYKFYSPSTKSKTVTPKIIITPALAVDYKGNRIGYGKGFYDRYYKNNKSSIYIGYIYTEQSFKALPFQKHDLKLNAIVTDTLVKIIDNKLL